VDAAIVICTRDRAALLERAIDAAKAALRSGDELVVVDSASRDRRAVEAVAAAAGVRLLRSDVPGASRARNAGAAATSAPLLVFTDDDCRPQQGWVTALDRAFADPRTGLVTGRILPDRAGGRVVSVLLDEQPRVIGASDDPATVGSGANMAFRREAFDAVGGFDEEFGPGARFRAAEDHELFWRVLRSAWVGRFAPDAVVIHAQWRGLRAFLGANASYGVGSGALAAKVARVDGARGRALLRAAFVDKGVRRALTHLRAGYELGAVASLVTAGGVAAGAARAAGPRWPTLPSGQAIEDGKELGGNVAP
jgi:GT2 family glycosyltransferase